MVWRICNKNHEGNVIFYLYHEQYLLLNKLKVQITKNYLKNLPKFQYRLKIIIQIMMVMIRVIRHYQ